MANSAYVSTGKPKVGGAIFRAPKGTTLPTDATSALDPAFKDIGFVSEDGVTNANSRESEDIKAWGGVTVLSSQTDVTDTWQAQFIESLNPEVLKMVFGENNVTGDLTTGITVTVNAEEALEAAYVFDMILKGGVLKRVVLPCAKMSELGETVYKDDEAIAYDVTLTALPDEKENMHYEYIVTPAQPGPTPTTHSVVQNLTDVTSSFSGDSVEDGAAFSAQLTAETGTIDSVTVTMGGTDITATAWDDATETVTIAAVTGDIVITASAA
jgi:hypothetical protein